ncbi:MAG: hypothetical protein NZ534_01050 [Bacteroidia bacterium]|nr:hypothetical protein [Bacteroidia bacterium]
MKRNQAPREPMFLSARRPLRMVDILFYFCFFLFCRAELLLLCKNCFVLKSILFGRIIATPPCAGLLLKRAKTRREFSLTPTLVLFLFYICGLRVGRRAEKRDRDVQCPNSIFENRIFLNRK